MFKIKFYIFCYFLFLVLLFFLTFYSFVINNSFDNGSIINSLFNKELLITDVGFFYGEYINNFLDFGEYYFSLDGIKLYLGRPYFIPVLLTLIFKFTNIEFFIFYIKNVFVFSLYFYATSNYFIQEKSKIKFFLILSAPFLIPYNSYQALQIVPEEAYLVFIIPSIFLCILSHSKNTFFFCFLIISCLFVKSPNVIIVYALLILIFFKNFEVKSKKFISIVILMFSLLWGSYGYYKSNIPALFHKSYTVNHFTGLQSHNIFFKYFYPEYSVDNITNYFNFFYKKILNKNEENFAKIFNLEIKSYIKDDFKRYLNQKLIIIRHMFFNIRKDGVMFTKKCNNSFASIMERMEKDFKIYELYQKEKDLMQECKGSANNEIRLEFLLNKVIWIVSIFIALMNIFYFKRKFRISFLFIYFNFFYILPYLYGHIYTRHQIVLFTLSIIFLFLNYNFVKNTTKIK